MATKGWIFIPQTAYFKAQRVWSILEGAADHCVPQFSMPFQPIEKPPFANAKGGLGDIFSNFTENIS